MGYNDLFRIVGGSGSGTEDLVRAAQRLTTSNRGNGQINDLLEQIADPDRLCPAAAPVLGVLLGALPKLTESERVAVIECAGNLAAIYVAGHCPNDEPDHVSHLQYVIDGHASTLVEVLRTTDEACAVAATELISYASSPPHEAWEPLLGIFPKMTTAKPLLLTVMEKVAPSREAWFQLLNSAITDPQPSVRFVAACFLVETEPRAESTLLATSGLALAQDGIECRLLIRRISELNRQRAFAILEDVLPGIKDSFVGILLLAAGIRGEQGLGTRPSLQISKELVRVWWQEPALQAMTTELSDSQKIAFRRLSSKLPFLTYDRKRNRIVETNLLVALKETPGSADVPQTPFIRRPDGVDPDR